MTDLLNPPGAEMNLTDQDRIRVCRVSQQRLIQGLPRANDGPIPEDIEYVQCKILDNGDFLFVVRSMQFDHYNVLPPNAATEADLLAAMLKNIEAAPQF